MISNRILRYETLESTNKKAKECADSLSHMDVIVTKEQTGGRGRMGRQWESKKGKDLMMTIVLKPKISPKLISMLTIVMALAVREALCDLRNDSDNAAHMDLPMIKWPNDIVISSKKVCGILTESSLIGDEVKYVIIGCGVNVRSEDFSLSIENMAGSIKTLWGMDIEPEVVMSKILELFEKYYEAFIRDKGLTNMVSLYNQSLVSMDKEVIVDEKRGICRGINNQGELLVERNNKIKCICAGEVSVRGIYGYV